MTDLFEREQQILDNALQYAKGIRNGIPCDYEMFEILTTEYGKLLRQLRCITKISDRATDNLKTSNLDLLDKVYYDALTGIYNRRYLEENLERIIGTISRSAGVLSVLMIDLDFYKKYNDTYGHNMGDECLKIVSKALNDSMKRSDDFVARYGGEEFVAVLPNTDKTGACNVANRLLEEVRACNIPHAQNSAANCVTVSIGVTTGYVECEQNGAEYIKRADAALYMSKQNGRNTYTFINLRGYPK